MSFNLKPSQKSKQSIMNMESEYLQGPGFKSQQLRTEFNSSNAMKNNTYLIKSQCLNEEDQVKMLLETIRKLEAENKEKQMFYMKTVADLTANIQAKAEENKLIKSQILQLKNQSKNINRETQNLLFQYSDKGSTLKKSTSAKSIFENGMSERFSSIQKPTTFTRRNTQRNIRQMF